MPGSGEVMAVEEVIVKDELPSDPAVDVLVHPFTPLFMMPWTRYFCANKYTTTTGTNESTTPAMTIETFQLRKPDPLTVLLGPSAIQAVPQASRSTWRSTAEEWRRRGTCQPPPPVASTMQPDAR
jgi:hypothetical protein